jgi:hypothetical protein
MKIAVSKSPLLGVDCRAETCKRTGKRRVGLLDVRLRPFLVVPGRRVSLSVVHSGWHILVRLAQSDEVRSITPHSDGRGVQAFARERRRFVEALVDPLSRRGGNTLYFGANRSETELLIEDAVAIFHSRLIPGYAEYFPGSGQKIPGYVATGICPQAIDESGPFRGRTAAMTLNRRDSRLSSRFMGIGAGIGRGGQTLDGAHFRHGLGSRRDEASWSPNPRRGERRLVNLRRDS